MDVETQVAVIKILKAARAKLVQGHSKGWFAFTKDGVKTESWLPDAHSFCMMGALGAGCLEVGIVNSTGYANAVFRGKAQEAVEEVAGINLASFNDTHSQEEVLAAMDQTIAREEAYLVKLGWQMPETD